MNLAILVPGPKAFFVFQQIDGRRLRRWQKLVPIHRIPVLANIACPLTVALVGTRYESEVAVSIANFADLLTIPWQWTQGIPRTDAWARARAAARICLAYQQAPLRVTTYDPMRGYEMRYSDDLPF
jgi:hypothetical protein